MRTPAIIVACVLALPCALNAQPSVTVQPPELRSPRPLAQQTADSAIRDYLQSWKGMEEALAQNRAGLLSPDFVGSALDKLTGTVQAQVKAGIHTRYIDRSHNIQIVFYSPEGLSIQLVDNVEYDEQVFDGDTLLTSQPVSARYTAVLTPSEIRWRVRVFQATPEQNPAFNQTKNAEARIQ